MVLLTLAISSLALGLGALYPKFDTENAAQIPTGFGGLVFMMSAIVLLGVVIVIEAVPVGMTYLRAATRGRAGCRHTDDGGAPWARWQSSASSPRWFRSGWGCGRVKTDGVLTPEIALRCGLAVVLLLLPALALAHAVCTKSGFMKEPGSACRGQPRPEPIAPATNAASRSTPGALPRHTGGRRTVNRSSSWAESLAPGSVMPRALRR